MIKPRFRISIENPGFGFGIVIKKGCIGTAWGNPNEKMYLNLIFIILNKQINLSFYWEREPGLNK
jgi:hypothetical protein